MSQFKSCLSFILLVPLYLVSASPTLRPRAQHNDSPACPGNADEGWQQLPDVVDYDTYPDWTLDGLEGIKMPLYQSKGKDSNKVKRAVIVMPGKNRDCWYYANSLQNGLYQAQESLQINIDEISLMAPCFLTEEDRTAGAAGADIVTWGKTTWVSGHYNDGPTSVDKYSSYNVLDALVDYYMDTTTYPNLKQVVVAGHSAGAQMTQRYAALRTSDTDDDRLHFWVANPGSLVWLDSDRPSPDKSCTDFDKYKYGLKDGLPGYASSEFSELRADGIVDRYLARQIHYAWGLADDGNGDTRCQAMTQGKTHLERGQNFEKLLKDDFGGLPDTQTIDYIPDVSHDNEKMINSEAGMEKLFRYPATA